MYGAGVVVLWLPPPHPAMTSIIARSAMTNTPPMTTREAPLRAGPKTISPSGATARANKYVDDLPDGLSMPVVLSDEIVTVAFAFGVVVSGVMVHEA